MSTCAIFNDCIGNDDFSPWTAGMLNYLPSWGFYNGGGLWGWVSAWQAWWAAWNSMPYRQTQHQPCSYASYYFYTDKVKRFVSSEESSQMASQSDIELQMYYQTGQCPLAFQLQNFLTSLLHNKFWMYHQQVLFKIFLSFLKVYMK
ncbi:MAG: hypothetical protein IPJ79_20765 [Bacteroidetes bacterium]|nr:hypothetical protein [Bacteroidota bacterium]